MPSRIFIICNSYESGFGHGLKNDGFDLSKTPHGDPECGEAYQIGYEAGKEAYYANTEREHFGDPDKRTGIYADTPNDKA